MKINELIGIKVNPILSVNQNGYNQQKQDCILKPQVLFNQQITNVPVRPVPKQIHDKQYQQSDNQNAPLPSVDSKAEETLVKEHPWIKPGKHPVEKESDLSHAFRPEKNPRKVHQDKGGEYLPELMAEGVRFELQKFGGLFSNRLQQVAYYLIQAVDCTPNDEGPGGSMPKTADGKCNQEVNVLSEFSLSVSAQRYLKIIPEPGTQGYVPAMPEVADAVRKIGRIKVLGQLKAHNSRSTHCHS